MEELSAHDHRKRPHAVGGGTVAAVAVETGPPMIRLTRSAAGAALRFEYRRMYTDMKRPSGEGITFEGELRLHVACMRVIWLQQWIAGAFDYLDNSILAKVVRGVSDLSIARAWVPPNRFRPMRLSFEIDQPTILFPRNVHALSSEALLAAHSLHGRLRSVRGASVLTRRVMPSCDEFGVLLCDYMHISFTDLHVHSQLPPATGASSDSLLNAVDAPLQLTIHVVKSIERPDERVPAMAVHATFGDGGLSLRGTVPQCELLWRIWRENISRPGRTAAGALGVWGMLLRPEKTKVIAVEATPLHIGIYAPADARAGAEEVPLATIRAQSLRFRAGETQSEVNLAFSIPGIHLDMPSQRGSGGAESGAFADHLPVIRDWDFAMLAREQFPGGCTYPQHVSRRLASSEPLEIHLCEKRLRALVELASRFVHAPVHTPNPVGLFPEREPDLRLIGELDRLSLIIHSTNESAAAPEVMRLSVGRLAAVYSGYVDAATALEPGVEYSPEQGWSTADSSEPLEQMIMQWVAHSELRMRLAPTLSLAVDASSVGEVVVTLARVRRQLLALGSLTPRVGSRVLLHGAYAQPASKEDAPSHVSHVSLGPFSLSLSLRLGAGSVARLLSIRNGSTLVAFSPLTLQPMRAVRATAAMHWHYKGQLARFGMQVIARSQRLQALLVAAVAVLLALAFSVLAFSMRSRDV